MRLIPLYRYKIATRARKAGDSPEREELEGQIKGERRDSHEERHDSNSPMGRDGNSSRGADRRRAPGVIAQELDGPRSGRRGAGDSADGEGSASNQSR